MAAVHSSPVQALEWQNMWQTSQSKGEASMQKKDYAKAVQQLERKDWQAVAHYQNKDYAAAVKDFQHIPKPTADDVYNQGNALAHLGKLDAAIAAYQKALAMNPNLKDAQANKALLEKLKAKQKKKKQDKSSKDGKQGKKSKPSDKGSKQPSKDGSSKQDDGKASDAKQTPSEKKASQKKTTQAKQASQRQQKDKATSAEKKSKHEKSTVKKGKQENKKKTNEQHALSQEDLKKLEKKQAFEQNMRRIPDDPGGLLRRKFRYQYQQEHQNNDSTGGVAW